MGPARGSVRFVRVLNERFGDLADFIVAAGSIDGVGHLSVCAE